VRAMPSLLWGLQFIDVTASLSDRGRKEGALEPF
jgi:hypothetical protein